MKIYAARITLNNTGDQTMNMTHANLRKLRLSSMAEALIHQIEQPHTYLELPFTERLDLLM